MMDRATCSTARHWPPQLERRAQRTDTAASGPGSLGEADWFWGGPRPTDGRRGWLCHRGTCSIRQVRVAAAPAGPCRAVVLGGRMPIWSTYRPVVTGSQEWRPSRLGGEDDAHPRRDGRHV